MSVDETYVSVLLVGDNLSYCLSPWLLHLENQDYPLGKVEWIIVERNPSENTRELIATMSQGSPVRVQYIPYEGETLLQAWNLGIREAKGNWVLCSLPDVVPASNWISRHTQLQNAYNGKACIAGALLIHPRLSERSITPWFLPEDSPLHREDKSVEVTPYQFSLFNMSFPRELAMKAGAFNKSFYFPEFAEVELVKRFSREGYPVHVDEQAVCWLWKGSSYLDMCKYHYRRGYSMGCYLRLYPQEYEIIERYRLYKPLMARATDFILVPYYHRLCLKFVEDSRAHQRMYFRVFRYWRYRGFSDAMSKQEPQLDIIYS